MRGLILSLVINYMRFLLACILRLQLMIAAVVCCLIIWDHFASSLPAFVPPGASNSPNGDEAYRPVEVRVRSPTLIGGPDEIVLEKGATSSGSNCPQLPGAEIYLISSPKNDPFDSRFDRSIDNLESLTKLYRFSKLGRVEYLNSLAIKYEQIGNYGKALDLYKEASGEGNVYGRFNAGRFYVEKLPQLAFNYFQQAANENLADAQYNLGVMLSAGIGVDCNVDEAISWWLKAGREGNVEAINALGLQDNLGHAKLMIDERPIDINFMNSDDVIKIENEIYMYSKLTINDQREQIIDSIVRTCSFDIEYVAKSVRNKNYSQLVGITSWRNCFIQAEKLLFQ